MTIPLDGTPFDSGYRRSPVDHRDWDYRALAMRRSPLNRVRTAPRTFRLDARSPLPVYNQGSVPSCVGWSLAALKTAQERKDLRRTVLFDGLEFYNRIALPGGGAYTRDALRLAADLGVQTQTGERRHTISGYAAVNPRDHAAVKHAIWRGRGVWIGFAVTRGWMGAGGKEFQTDAGGPQDEVVGHHAMYVPGYVPAGPEGLNSWGDWWGVNGRGVLPWAYWDRHVWECWTLVDVDD